jgi:hypothetical protein
MDSVITFEGIVTASIINIFGGGPANVAHWPRPGSAFKGSFAYHPAVGQRPGLFTDFVVDYESFSITRSGSTGAIAINITNGGAGVQYADGDSTGFHNRSLPQAGWELNAFEFDLFNPQNTNPPVDPGNLNFDLFATRMFHLAGDSGPPLSGSWAWNIWARIDCLIRLPTP